MIEVAGDTPSQRTPHRIRLRSSNRLFELFCCPINALSRCIKAVAIAFQRFFLHKSDDFRLVTRFEKRLQLSLKITYVGHRFELLIRYTTALDLAHRVASLCLWHTVGSQVRSILGMPSFRHAVGREGMRKMRAHRPRHTDKRRCGLDPHGTMPRPARRTRP